MKYRVYGIMTASCLIGEYEADSEDDAKAKAESDGEANWYPTLCHQCSTEVELEEIYETQIVNSTGGVVVK